MIYIINIVAPTKDSDLLYSEVAINTWPIVWLTEDDDISALWGDPEFKEAMTKIVRSKKVYENAIIYYRNFDDDLNFVKEDKFKLKEKINIELK